MNTKFKTIKQIQRYVSNAKKQADKIRLKFPEYSSSSMHFSDLSLDLIYKIDDFLNKDKPKTYYSNSEKLEHKNDRLTIYAFSKFSIMCFFQSVEVIKDCDCVERKEFKEKVIKETV